MRFSKPTSFHIKAQFICVCLMLLIPLIPEHFHVFLTIFALISAKHYSNKTHSVLVLKGTHCARTLRYFQFTSILPNKTLFPEAEFFVDVDEFSKLLDNLIDIRKKL